MLKDNSTLMHIKQHLQEKKTNNQIHDMQATARYKFIDQPTVDLVTTHVSYSFKKKKMNGTSITIVLACDQSIQEKKKEQYHQEIGEHKLKLRSNTDKKISLTSVAENRNQAVEMNGGLLNSKSSIDIIKRSQTICYLPRTW